ncbi:MAG: hypothetical protein ACRD01_00735 [Terriglobales bacterium]
MAMLAMLVCAAAVAQTGSVDPAYAAGYNRAYPLGQADHAAGFTANAHKFSEYQEGARGYTAAYGTPAAYKASFQSGFDDGYRDGYAGQGRSIPAPAAATAAPATPATAPGTTAGDAAAAAGTNNMPTDPERAAARPSAVYDNGILVAQDTQLQTTLDRQLDTKHSYAGESFTLTITVPVWVGAVAAIPAGSTIQGTVAQLARGGKLSGHAQIQLQYDTLTIPGQDPIALHGTTAAVGAAAQTVNSQEGTVNGQGANTGKRVATGAGIGAVLGGIFGGGGGLIRGGIAGAALGTAGVLVSHSKDLTLRQGERILVRLERPLELPPNGNPQ